MAGVLLVILLCMSSPPATPGGEAGSAVRHSMQGVRILVLDFSREGVSPEHLDMFHSLLAARMQSETATVLIGREAVNEIRGVTFSPEAAEALQRARASLSRGKDLYENLRFDEAIRELTTASRLFEDNLEFLESLSPAEDAHVSLALALQAMGEEDKAKEELMMVLARNAGKTLEESSYPPSLVSTLEAVRKDAMSSPSANIFVETSPPLALVYLDGKKKGTSPLTIRDVRPGAHLLTAEKMGFRRAAVRFVPGRRSTGATDHESVTMTLKSLEGEKSYERLRSLAQENALQDASGDQIGETIPGIGRSCGADYVLITVLKPMMDTYDSLFLLYDANEGRALHKEEFSLPPQSEEMGAALDTAVRKILPLLIPLKEGGWEVSKDFFPRVPKERWYRSWKVWAPLAGAFLIASGSSFYAAQEASRNYASKADAYNAYMTSPQVLDPGTAKSLKDSSEKYRTQFTLYSTWGYVTLGFSAVFIGTWGYFSFSGESSGPVSTLSPRINVVLVPLDGGAHLTVSLVSW